MPKKPEDDFPAYMPYYIISYANFECNTTSRINILFMLGQKTQQQHTQNWKNKNENFSYKWCSDVCIQL